MGNPDMELTKSQVEKANLADVPLGVIRYEVVITEVRREVTVKAKVWQPVHHRENEGGSEERGVPDYSPETLETREVSSEIFRQTVEDLDIGNVIRVVNNL